MSKKKHRRIWDTQAQALMNSASFTECTGLMPSKPLDDHQWDAYKDIVSMATSEEAEEKDVPEDI